MAEKLLLIESNLKEMFKCKKIRYHLKAHNHLPSDRLWLFWRAGTVSQNGGK